MTQRSNGHLVKALDFAASVRATRDNPSKPICSFCGDTATKETMTGPLDVMICARCAETAMIYYYQLAKQRHFTGTTDPEKALREAVKGLRQ